MNTTVVGMKPAGARALRSVRLVLAAVFLAAGLLKIVQPAKFYDQLLAYETGLSADLLRLIAVWLPWVEISAGGVLLTSLWTETVALLVSALYLLFTALLGQAVLRGLDFNCGCFGAATPAWFDHPPMALLRTGLLLVMATWLWLQAATHRMGTINSGEVS
jgi:putative oxidoreductase